MIVTPDHAREHFACPIGRTFADTHSTCIADKCPIWRWKALTTNEPGFKAAVSDALRMSENKGSHKKAVAWVMERRADLGLPDKPYEGWCGLGGKPEA